jgi:ABC-type ATPase involved in cell division
MSGSMLQVHGFAGAGKTFLCPLIFYPRAQTQTRIRTRGHKIKPVSSPLRVFTRGHAGILYPLPSLSSEHMSRNALYHLDTFVTVHSTGEMNHSQE